MENVTNDDSIVDLVKIVLSNTFSFYLKAHSFHWNVEGSLFKQFHDFFGSIYESVYSSIDDIAEHIRAIGAYAPGTFERFLELSQIKSESGIPTEPYGMIEALKRDNRILLNSLYKACKEAEKQDLLGLANFLQDRIDAHNKINWMLTATNKS